MLEAMKQLIGKQFERATIFEPGYLTGYRQSEIRELRFCTGLSWGKEHFAAQFIFRGKRKTQLKAAGQWVIINGWDHPKLECEIKETSLSGLTSFRPKFSLVSEEWDLLLDEYLKSLGSQLEVIFDGRTWGGSIYTKDFSPSNEKTKSEKSIEVTDNISLYSDETEVSDIFREGTVQEVLANEYERNPAARQRCLDHYGYTCCVCLINLQNIYGDLGRNFIHVHHKVPLANIGEEYQVDPINDLVPVCPNCHAMLHRPKEVLTIEELREIIQKNCR